MSKTHETQVLIVGAGPTGLTAAIELTKRGIKCRIIDSLPAPSEKSRALAIHCRTLELFEKMELIEEFLALGWKSTAFTVFDRHKKIVRMTFNELDSAFPFLLSIPQHHTERILAQRLGTLGGAIEWNTTLDSLLQENGSVHASVKKSKDGKESDEKISSHWLLGCDGAHSKVRNLLNIDFKGMPYWEQYVLADVKYDTGLDPHDHYIFSGKEGIAGLHPFGEDCGRVFADLGRIHRTKYSQDRLPVDRPGFPEPTFEQLQAILDQRGPGDLRLKHVNWQSMHTIHRRQAQAYRKGHVLLAGDAAHIHSPTGGQGMNLGIQDAYNVAWKLALVEKKVAQDKLLDGYGTERALTCRQVSTMSEWFSRINNVRSPIFQAIRNTVGPFLAAQPAIRHHYRNCVSEIAINYRLSPVVSECTMTVDRPENTFITDTKIKWSAAPRPGDRVPNISAWDLKDDERVSLYDLMKAPTHHLLLFTGQIEEPGRTQDLIEIAKKISDRYPELIKTHFYSASESCLKHLHSASSKFMDRDLSAHTKYGATLACLFLIRPDGYLAFRSLPPNEYELTSYLDSLFLIRPTAA